MQSPWQRGHVDILTILTSLLVGSFIYYLRDPVKELRVLPLTYMEVQQKNSHRLKKASGPSDVEDLVKQSKLLRICFLAQSLSCGGDAGMLHKRPMTRRAMLKSFCSPLFTVKVPVNEQSRHVIGIVQGSPSAPMFAPSLFVFKVLSHAFVAQVSVWRESSFQ